MKIAFTHHTKNVNSSLRELSDAFLGIQITTKEQHISVPFFGAVTLTFCNRNDLTILQQLHSVPSTVACITVKKWVGNIPTNNGVEYEVSIQNVAKFNHDTDVCSITFDNCWIRITAIEPA